MGCRKTKTMERLSDVHRPRFRGLVQQEGMEREQKSMTQVHEEAKRTREHR